MSAKAKTSPIAPTAKPNNICKIVFRVALLAGIEMIIARGSA
jgi:hypothetical protein